MSQKILQIKSEKSVHPWITSSHFENASQSEVLDLILRRVKEEAKLRIRHGGRPIKVVFDLDSTIFDVKPRTLRLLKEFAGTVDARKISEPLCAWTQTLRVENLLYTLEESAHHNKIPLADDNLEPFLKAAFRYWRERFFTHSYVMVDNPTPGAVDFVNQVVDLGGIAIYLTGRDWPGMGRGTQATLDHWGFPVDPRVSRLLMKSNAGLDDAEFKDEALRELRIEGNAVALIDNEPANFGVFEKNFPEAILVLYHSNCSSKEAKPVKKLYKIESFLRF